MIKITKIDDDLKSKLLKQSMAFVSDSAYDYCEYVCESDYFYLIKFQNISDYTVLSKDDKQYMIVVVFDEKSDRYKEYKDECVEVLDGYYMFTQIKNESEFSFMKMNYWLDKLKCTRRDIKLNQILN